MVNLIKERVQFPLALLRF